VFGGHFENKFGRQVVQFVDVIRFTHWSISVREQSMNAIKVIVIARGVNQRFLHVAPANKRETIHAIDKLI